LIKKVVISVVCLTLMSGMLSSQVEAQASDEYQVKAAFLYNFLKFVDWPTQLFANDSAPFIIGVVGNDGFNSAIDQAISGKTANGRRVVIKRFPSFKTLTYCHMLFISSSERDNLRQILAIAGPGVLTVSETERFTQLGGIINFTIVDSKVRFEINQSAAERAGLRISAKLLSLARIVRN
jgi:YfiR/HmsC-like